MKKLITIILILININTYSQVSIRGYTQVRYNKLFETNPNLGCEQCDKSWGGNEGFFIRRSRIIFYGNASDRVSYYIQPDFASAISSTSLNYLQIRDAYFDISIDKNKEFRFRIGQSKVPFGFENMQSSQNRIPLDRNDALNSAVSNERDLGIFFYWTPKSIKETFNFISKNNLKHSGDYGMFGIGTYNGQTSNKPDQNSNKHFVTRLSYPIKIKDQIIEPGIQFYTGKFIVTSVSKDVKGNNRFEYLDSRSAASFVLYPQPFGIQAEYNIGTGPRFNPNTNTIEQSKINGGYSTLSYMIKSKEQYITPFTRYHYYNGGKKHELDARSYKVNDLEIGIEYQPYKSLEITAMYTISKRKYDDFLTIDNYQYGRLLRLQAQVNF